MKIPIPAAAMLCMMAMSLSEPAAVVAADADAPLRPDILRPMAEHGDVWAQMKLGGLYDSGEGVAKDEDQAADWYAKAAEQGSLEARTLLTLVCAGHVMAPDQPRACAKIGPLLQAAAKKGDLASENMLARFYEVGMFGVAKDPVQALFWLRKAAEQGEPSSQSELAVRYQIGDGIPKDEVQAAFWNRKAAEQGDMLAQITLAGDYETGRGVAADESQAVAWYLKAAEQGYPDAQRKVGTAYALGKGAPRDDVQAYMWLQVAMSSARSNDEHRDIEALALKSVGERLSPAALAHARRLAATWKAGTGTP